MSTIRPARTALYVLAASASPAALVIRRGPSKWWHFLLWNRDTGMVEPGSWFHGMVYPAECDISPRGDFFVFLALRGCGAPPAWTAICRPPFVRAVAFWPQDCARYGGGYFDERLPVVWLNIPADTITPHLSERLPIEFGYQEERGQFFGSLTERLRRAGWKPEKKGASGRWVLPSPDRKWELLLEFPATAGSPQPDPAAPGHAGGGEYAVRQRGDTAPHAALAGTEWAGWNSKNLLSLAGEGTLRTARPGNPQESLTALDLRALQPGSSRQLPRRSPAARVPHP